MSSFAALAGITMVVAYRRSVIAGPLIALAIVPAAAMVGVAFAAGSPTLAYQGAERFILDMALIVAWGLGSASRGAEASLRAPSEANSVVAVLSLEQSREYGRKNMTRTFSIDTPVDSLSLLARAKRVAKENGATLIGDKESGRFSHDMVRGEYRMVGQTVIITIIEKHWLVPWPIVESRLRELVR